MNNYNIYWGDMHCHYVPSKDFPKDNPLSTLSGWENFIEQSIKESIGYIDFLPVLYYPAYKYKSEMGLPEETMGMQDGFVNEWEYNVSDLLKEKGPLKMCRLGTVKCEIMELPGGEDEK